MFNQFTIARVYAKAVFDLSIQHNNLNQWKSTLELFSKIAHNTLLQPLCHNIIDTKKLSEIIITLFEDCNNKTIDLLSRNFIYIVVKNRRVLLLPIIFKEFNNLYNNYMKIITIEVISAHKLNNNQLKKIAEIMRYRLSKTITIVPHIDKNILAGIIIKIEDTIIDGSLMGRILRLNSVLQI